MTLSSVFRIGFHISSGADLNTASITTPDTLFSRHTATEIHPLKWAMTAMSMVRNSDLKVKDFAYTSFPGLARSLESGQSARAIPEIKIPTLTSRKNC